MLRPRPIAVLAAVVAGLVSLPAQVPTRGVLAGAPVAVLVDGGLAPGGDAETRVHRNGFALLPTVPLPAAPSAPDLRQIFAALGAPAGIGVDDISTGRDDVLFDGNGVMAVPPSSWGVLSFSLRNGAVGAPGSRIAQQVAEGDVGATLFSWVLPGSAVPAQLIQRTERSHSRQELGLAGAGVLEVDAIDVPLLLGLDQQGLSQLEPGFQVLIQAPQAIYFTVSHATRHLVPAAWWLFGGNPTLSSGASILRVLKSSQFSAWSTPHVFVPYGVLGLARDEDIDGLAYDGVREKLLFSVVGTARDQFLFHDVSTDAPGNLDAKMPDGVDKVSDHVGKAQNDDVDAICTLDPQIRSVGSPPPQGDDFGSSCGSPRQGLLGVPSVHGSAFRRHQGAQTIYDAWLIGWPPLSGQGPGYAVLFVTFGADLTLHLAGPVQLRDPLAAVPGDPRHQELVIPPVLALTGFDITFRWAAVDVTLAEIAEAWPMQVFL